MRTKQIMLFWYCLWIKDDNNRNDINGEHTENYVGISGTGNNVLPPTRMKMKIEAFMFPLLWFPTQTEKTRLLKME